MGKAARLRQQRRQARKYLHGGVPGLDVGDVLRGRNAMPAWTGRNVIYNTDANDEIGSDPTTGDFVYLTTDLDVARHFAHCYIGPDTVKRPGDVYEVQVDGARTVDPDFHFYGVERFCRAPQARITQVVERSVELGPEAFVRSIGRYQRWTLSRPVYDADGYMLPSPVMEEAGVTAVVLRRYGRWIPMDHVTVDGRLKRPRTPSERLTRLSQ